MDQRLVRLSKYLAKYLRHAPEDTRAKAPAGRLGARR